MNNSSIFWQREKKIKHGIDEHKKHTKYTHNLEYVNMKSKQINAKLLANLKRKGALERTKFDAKGIEQLKTTIEDLKAKVNYFENYFMYDNANQKGDSKIEKNSQGSNYIDENYMIGDTNERKGQKLGKYTTHFTKPIKIEQFGISPKPKHESDASIVKSSLSLTKNTYINITPTLDSRNLKSAAQDFIKQAEELKTNIAYMLDTENCDSITLSDDSEHFVDPCNKENNMASNEFSLQYLLLLVSEQYQEILKTLRNIEQYIKNNELNLHKKSKLSQAATKVSTYIPNNVYKVETFKNGKIDTKPPSDGVNLEAVKKKSMTKKLDPIVLVYEPIKPIDFPQNFCTFCGNPSASCIFENMECCHNNMIKPGFDNKDVSCGFMVSYTPNIAHSIKSESCKNSVNKKDKVVKKKKSCCFWF